MDVNMTKDMTLKSAVYELVQNSLDQELVSPSELLVATDEKTIVVRDNGRGITPDNFIMGRACENHRHSVHGRGLKDAVACILRERSEIRIDTVNATITFEVDSSGCVSVVFDESNPRKRGTVITVEKVPNAKRIVEEVKRHFLQFLLPPNDEALRSTSQCIVRDWPNSIPIAGIFLNGVLKNTGSPLPRLVIINEKKGDRTITKYVDPEQNMKRKWKKKLLQYCRDNKDLEQVLNEYAAQKQRSSVPTPAARAPAVGVPRTAAVPVAPEIPRRDVCGLTEDQVKTCEEVWRCLSVTNAPLTTMSAEQAEHHQQAWSSLQARLKETLHPSAVRLQGSFIKNTAIPFDTDFDVIVNFADPAPTIEQVRERLLNVDFTFFAKGSKDILTGLYRHGGVAYPVDLLVNSQRADDGAQSVAELKDTVEHHNYVLEVIRIIKYIVKRHVQSVKSVVVEDAVQKTFTTLGTNNSSSEEEKKVCLLKQSLKTLSTFRSDKQDASELAPAQQFLTKVANYFSC